MGLTLTEQLVLDRFDRGQSVDQIARATRYRRSTVLGIVQKYDVNLAQDSARENAVRLQSTRLGELVRQAGGHR